MEYNTHTFSNGLRIIHHPAPGTRVTYCGYQINAGSRHEAPGEEGLAHFCEHVTFKGTEHRSALQIINSLESIGGELNAYTNKEETVFYAALLREHTMRAVDLLTDIVFHSVYPQTEIDKEVEVICDEIESYNDSPAELIYDEFDNILFKGHPLGHNILGSAEQVRKFTTQDALRFTRKHYRPNNAIFFIYGDVDFKKIVKKLETLDMGLQSADTPSPKPQQVAEGEKEGKHAQYIEVKKGTHQAHVMIGTRAFSVHDGLRLPLYLLNNILGGPGMNARLNMALRERSGLVYNVESSMVCYGDTGTWSIYFGCDAHDVKRCIKLVQRELKRLILHPLTPTQLNAAKKQIKGQIGVACDNRESFALDMGKSFLHYGWLKDTERLYEQLDAITSSEMHNVAQQLFFPEKLTTMVYC